MHLIGNSKYVRVKWYVDKEYNTVTEKGVVLKGTPSDTKGFYRNFGIDDVRVELLNPPPKEDVVHYLKINDYPESQLGIEAFIARKDLDVEECERNMIGHYEVYKR